MIAVPAIFAILILIFIIRGTCSYRSLIFTQVKNPPKGLSVIIPFRNEETNLEPLLQSLASQSVDIPFEIVLVNDSSEDNFEAVIERFIATTGFSGLKLIHSHYSSEIDLSSKQQAIDLGVAHSQFDWLVFTDADMIFSDQWLINLTMRCDSEHSPFVYGRTSIVQKNTLLSWIQELQLDFLFGTAWLFSLIGMDSSCMGNNIAVSKELYKKIGGQAGLGFTIVEDKKLLSAIKKVGVTAKAAHPFIDDAHTYAVNSPKVYLHQMLRWLKGGGGESFQLFLIVLLLGGELISIGAALFMETSLLFNSLVAVGVCLTWGLFILIFTTLKPMKRGWQLPLFLLILSIESLFVIPALIFITPQWKGRLLRNKGN